MALEGLQFLECHFVHWHIFPSLFSASSHPKKARHAPRSHSPFDNLCLQGACHYLQSHLPGEPGTVLVGNFGPPTCLQLLQKVRPSHVGKVLHRHTAESHDEQDWCNSSLWCLGVSTESLQTKETNVTAPGDSTTSSSRAATS